MDGILVFARVGGTKHFIGVFSDLEELQWNVEESLNKMCRPNWKKNTFFLMNGEEYKLFSEDDE